MNKAELISKRNKLLKELKTIDCQIDDIESPNIKKEINKLVKKQAEARNVLESEISGEFVIKFRLSSKQKKFKNGDIYYDVDLDLNPNVPGINDYIDDDYFEDFVTILRKSKNPLYKDVKRLIDAYIDNEYITAELCELE